MTLNEILETSVGSLTVGKVGFAVIMAVICIIACKLIMRVVHKALEKSRKIDAGLHSFVETVIKFMLYFTAVLVVADSIGISISSLLALFSVVGLALSLAVQESLAKVAGGVMILMTKPFAIGDYVEIGGISGSVSEIGMIYTHIRTIDNKTVYLTNNEVANGKIINYSQLDRRMLILQISASYDDKTQDVKAALFDAIASVDVILDDPAPFVSIEEYQDSSILYVVRAWVPRAEFIAAKYALNERVRESFDKFGVSMTYNHLNVHMIGDKP